MRVMGLLHLPDEIQGYVMALPSKEQRHYSGRQLRDMVALPNAAAQLRGSEELRDRTVE